ncbi:hypothetical protein RHMOL_Rhmol06G0078500 [Rhododendron molle]|uniref:Uncharacterized protein n=1 Tax=Rhododendron molle TaxID=49168 RepID=A0ACC0NA96_RHOML|nr:hypothetical protein RHMOL_Rhmol06G0078500 [Rhododendron molle]
MSWLARSIADSLRIDDDGENTDDDDDDEEEEETIPRKPNPNHSQSKRIENDDVDEEDRQGRGVREDITEFTETLTRQLWGVASFLAPPPPPPPPPLPPYHNRIDQAVADRDHWEHRDQSRNEVESPPLELEDEIVGVAAGVTEEVLAFAMNIAHHPETWLDFPMEEEDDVDDLEMSNAQHEHVLAIQRLAPRLTALRIELCPAHMSDSYFWKVYFVLLHSRLHKHDAELLSTPQIVAARAMWMQELQKRTKTETGSFGRGTSCAKESANRWNNRWEEPFDDPPFDDTSGNMSVRTCAFEPATYSVTTEFETEKHPVASTEIGIVDKSVIEEEPMIKTRDVDLVAGPSFKAPIQNYDDEDEDDDWLKEDSELDGYSGTATFFGNDEDVSFSDLEEDDDCTMPLKPK